MLSPFTKELIELESKTLLQLSRAARVAVKGQIALNAVVQAQQLPNMNSVFDVSHEFANVLWMMKEPTLAMQFLKSQLPSLESGRVEDQAHAAMKKAHVLALLVCTMEH